MSNLLEKASIITTPTAYENGKLLSVKGGTVADFDFSRGSSATRLNSQGLIEDVQIIGGDLVQNGDFSQEGSEVFTNGDFSTDSDWFKGGSATISGGYLNLTASGDFAQQSITNPSHYVVRINVSSVTTSGDLRIRSNNFAETFTFSVTSAQVYTFYSPISADGFVIQSNGFIGSIDNVSVKEVGQNWVFSGESEVTSQGGRVYSSSGSISSLQQNSALIIGKTYKLTFNVIDTDGSNLSNSNGSIIYNTSTTGLKTFQLVANTTSLVLKRYSGATDVTITNISVKEITDDTDIPRIDYTGGVGSILLEPSSSNIITDSETFSGWSLNGNISTTQVQQLNPSGQSGCLLLSGATDINWGGSNNVFQRGVSSINSNSSYTFSVFVKSLGSTTFTTTLRNNNTGTLDRTVHDIDGNWKRVSVTASTNSTQSLIGIVLGGTNGDVLLWGAQLEEQSFATSYIPTSSSTVTRLGETLNNSGNADLFNSEEGVLYAEIAALTNISTATKRVITLKNTDSSKRASIIYNADSTLAFFFSESPTVFYQTSAYDITQNLKIAFKYKENDFAVWVNGVEIFTDTSNNTFTADTLNGLHFNEFGTNSPFYGKTKCVAVFKEALTDTELQCLTT